MKKTFYLPDKCEVISFSDAALREMLRFQQNSKKASEAGGVLLGRQLLDSTGWIVDAVSVPCEADLWSRFGFKRSRKYHQKITDELWVQSHGTVGYLGEWHTHPEDHPTPSTIDIREWKRVLKKFQFDGNYAFFAILGRISLAVFQGNRQSQEIIKLISK